MTRVEWSEPAREDLEDIQRYISRDSVQYADAFIERLLRATRRLGDFPESGRIVPEDDTRQTREVIVQGYRIMYEYNAARVLILAVMSGTRDLTNPAQQPWRW